MQCSALSVYVVDTQSSVWVFPSSRDIYYQFIFSLLLSSLCYVLEHYYRSMHYQTAVHHKEVMVARVHCPIKMIEKCLHNKIKSPRETSTSCGISIFLSNSGMT